MESHFNIVFTGKLKPGVERDAFLKAFSQRFKCSEAKAAELLDAGKPVTMKRSIEKNTAEQYRDSLEALGMIIRLEPLPEQAAALKPAPLAPATESPAKSVSTVTDNPYQAPAASLHEPLREGEMSDPVSVPFGHGTRWISDAYGNHFKGNALAWIGAFIVFSILSMAIQLVPLIGLIISPLISPILMAGFMIGARAQDDGEDFSVNYLFSGFKQSAGQLALVGVLYMLGIIAAIVVSGLFMGGSFAMLGAMEGGNPAAAEAMAANPMTILLPVLVMMLLFFPVLMAYWFAPALVALNGLSALNAMKLSFIGSIKNVLPFTLYGIVLLVLMFVATIPLFLGYFILFPIIIASVYTAYRDIYYAEA